MNPEFLLGILSWDPWRLLPTTGTVHSPLYLPRKDWIDSAQQGYRREAAEQAALTLQLSTTDLLYPRLCMLCPLLALAMCIDSAREDWKERLKTERTVS